jgi:hypothetical protein
MVFKLFSEVRYHELSPFLSNVKELNFNKCDVWVDVDNKKLELYTDNGKADVSIDSYDELVNTMTELGKDMLANDLIDALNKAINDLTSYRSYYNIEFDKDVIRPLLDEIEKKKKEVFDSDFTALIRLGTLKEEEVEKLIRNDPAIKKAVRKAVRKYRELCWEDDQSDEPEDCDHVEPVIDFVVFVIPKEKRIDVRVYADQVGEVYKLTKTYGNSYDFLKAIDEYWEKVMSF